MYKKYFTLFFVFFSVGLIAQNMSKLTPQQQRRMQEQMSMGSENFSSSPALPSSQKKGSSDKMQTYTNQMSEFRKYINELNENMGEGETPYYVDERMFEEDSLYREFIKYEDKKKLKVFGSDIFDRNKFTFEPNLYLPTPTNYQIGTNDELLIDVSGLYDVSYKLIVNPEGNVRIPNAGLIKVAGMTVQAATNAIKRELSKYYTGISTSETIVSVGLGKIRSIQVTVAGEARYPGTYTLPSLATVVNALYACGGPSEIGSMRKINLIRGGKRYAEIDLYEFLTTGIMKNNVVLHDSDIILIESNQNQVIVDGAINRRGIYEVKQGESLFDMLGYAGGFRADANRSLVSIFRYDKNQKTVVDIPEEYLSSSLVKSGDSIYIAKIEDIFNNKVELSGAVYRPGGYALSDGMTVKKLIDRSGGVTDEAFVNMATLKRQRENEMPEVISFNLGKIIKGEAQDILLMKGDSVMVDSVSNFMEEQFVIIEGEVIKPGRYELSTKMRVKDLVFLAKGFTDKASTENVQLIRVLKDPKLMEDGSKKSETMTFSLDKDLNIEAGSADVLLENGDIVIVRPIEGIEPVRIAAIEGEVKNPGFYNIEHKNIRVSDLIEMSGGFTRYAFTEGAYIIRNEQKDRNPNAIHNVSAHNLSKILIAKTDDELDEVMRQRMRVESVVELDTLDSIFINIDERRMKEMLNFSGVVSLDLASIQKEPGGAKDILIEDGDVLYIPKRSLTVKVIGEVMYPSFVVHNKSRTFRQYITSSGGFSHQALKRKSFVLYPNGKVKGTRSFMGIKVYPEVTPGSIIIVPKVSIADGSRVNVTEVVAITSSLTSTAVLIYSVLK